MDRRTALGYVRKSYVRGGGADPASPEVQEQAIGAAIARHGWQAELYSDTLGHNSGRTENRPGWQALRARLADADVAAVVVYAWGRAFRSAKLLLQFVDECDSLGVKFLSLTQHNIDTSTADGRMVLTILAAVDEGESNRTSERRIESWGYLRSKGRHLGSVPFGAERRLVNGDRVLSPSARVQPNGTDHDCLRVIYERYGQGLNSTWSLAAWLNSNGWRFRDRHGNLRDFIPEDIRRIVGYNRWLYAGYLNVRPKYAEHHVVKGSHAPLLPESVLSAAAARYERMSRRSGRGRAPLVYPLSGILFCACGQKLSGFRHFETRYYRHKNLCALGLGSRRAEPLEDAVRSRLAALAWPADFTAASDAEVLSLLAADANGDSHGAARRAVESALERLRQLYVWGDVSEDDYQAQRAELAARLPPEPRPEPAIDLEQAVAVYDVRRGVETLPPAGLQALAAAVYARIDIEPGGGLRYTAREWCPWAA